MKENSGAKMNSVHSNHQKHRTNLRTQTIKHTLRCLLGCNIGEMSGMILGNLFGLEMTQSVILAVVLAFVTGYAFTMIPMLKTMSIKQAAKVTVLGDTASISSMEVAENSIAFLIPGFIHATLTDAIFWLGLGILLPVGFLASFPIMYWAMKGEQKRSSAMSTHCH